MKPKIGWQTWLRSLSVALSCGILQTSGKAGEREVLHILENHCAACHRDEEEPFLHRETSLLQLRSNDKFITAGVAATSPLFKLINLPADHKKRMPKSSVKKPLPPLSTEEIETIRVWIEGGSGLPAAAPPTPAASDISHPVTVTGNRSFVSESMVAATILADLKKLQSTPGPKTTVRYLSLTNLYNERDAKGNPLRSDQEMELARAGINKLLNSLSWNPNIIKVTPLGPDQTLLRIQLDAYGFKPEIWNRIVKAYPYLVDRRIAELAESEKILGSYPVLRADYFAFICAQAPLYHDIIGIPGGQKQRRADVELERKLNVAYHQAVLAAETVRAGFQKSGVSQGNRMIERLDRGNGAYYWKSYDFDPNRQNEQGGDLFRSPLGPLEAALTNNKSLIFSHDGGELIFSLPNGLQAYMLIDANGIRLDEAPINVVTDKSRKDSRIINGISCISCHKSGMFSTNVKDEVKATAATLNLAPPERASVERLYDQAKLEKYFAADGARFETAMRNFSEETQEEPVAYLYNRFRDTLNAGQMAAELGIESEIDLVSLLTPLQNAEIVNFVAKMKVGTSIPRLDFEKTFPILIKALQIGKMTAREVIATVEFGGDLDPELNARSEGGTGPVIRGGARPKRNVIRIDGGTGEPSTASSPQTTEVKPVLPPTVVPPVRVPSPVAPGSANSPNRPPNIVVRPVTPKTGPNPPARPKIDSNGKPILPPPVSRQSSPDLPQPAPREEVPHGRPKIGSDGKPSLPPAIQP